MERQSPAMSRPPSTNGAGPETKRRRIRKGTRSCWECKRRKIRCKFDSETDAVCIGCRHRGTKCVSQEFPEEASAPGDRGRQMGERIVRVEALVEQLVQSVATGTTKQTPTLPDTGIPTPSSSTSELPHLLSLYEPASDKATQREHHPSSSLSTPNPYGTTSPETPRIVALNSSCPPRYAALSAALYAAFPSPEDLAILCEHGAAAVTPFNQLATTPLSVIEVDGPETSDVWFRIPDRNMHPVLIAKAAMILATTLQGLFPSTQTSVPGVSEPPQVIYRRLADTTRSLVVDNDEFLGTVEGLQCIIFEALYQANWGNLRRAWLTMRRAMVVAQLIGIHKSHNQKPLKIIDPTTPAYPRYLWFRIVFADRLLSMMLGLPQGTMDMSMASPDQLAEEVPAGRLERVHCAISARILERNESDPPCDDYTKTKAIDSDLQKAVSMMPGRWWLTPNLAKVAAAPRELFWEALRLAKQVYHFYLLIQVHLPYMMLSNNGVNGDNAKRASFEYSKATCVIAAREILTRFVVYRSFNRVAFCCRNIDFFALLAAMTLTLAHLEGHQNQRSENVLAHQRISDRAMMDEVLDNMECVAKLNDDPLSDKCGDLLRRLLAIEDEAASGNEKAATDRLDDSIEDALRICIPYYGTVVVKTSGLIFEDRPSQGPNSQERSTEAADHVSETPGTLGSVGMHDQAWGYGLPVLPREVTAVDSHHPSTPDPQQAFSHGSRGLSTHPPGPPLPFENPSNDVSIAAGIDDWTFQGVDMAFFDALMRGTPVEDLGGLRL